MPISENDFYKTRVTITEAMLDELLSLVPDAYTGDDGILWILMNIEAGQFENVFLANQLLLEDLFPQTASQAALRLHGEQYGEAYKDGLKSTGTLRFAGQGGVYIPFNTEVAYDPGTGVDPIYFVTTTDGTLPNPGIPTAPNTPTDNGAGALTAGAYSYAVTFLTAAGETLPGPASASISLGASRQISVTGIPLGGPGTIGRKIYRSKDGGQFLLVSTINDNTTTTLSDNNASPGATVGTADTAIALSLAAEAQEPGLDGNVGPGTITDLTNAPTGLTDVTNPSAFTGGTDPEDTEDFRERLLGRIRSPQTGSPSDLKTWAESVEGVETATVFSNMNITTPANGHTTVRISGPNGTVPSADVITAVFDLLASYDFANITIHVTTFTQQPTNVTVSVTLASGYTHADVDASIIQAIKDYINALSVGGTLYVTGIIDAVFGLTGVLDVSVTTPASNQTTASDTKRTPGTITVT